METKEYIVILEDGINYDTVWNDIENTTSVLPHIPDRAVTIVNNRDVQPQMCHYALTDDEAEKLQLDSRVLAVERPLADLGLFPVTPVVFGPSTTSISFKIPSQDDASGNHVNWSLIRNSYPKNTYTDTTTTSREYVYGLDGTNVDVVIMDTGIEYYHPEFKDKNGNVRIVLQNWTGSLDTTPNSTNFSDTNGHGTASASLVAGLNYGWARNATIYPCKISTGGAGGLDFAVACDAITAWHKAKTNSRPTVVLGEVSYVLPRESTSIISINYRNGGDISTTVPETSKGMAASTAILPIIDFPTGSKYNITPQAGQTFRSPQVDIAVENMITNGIIFVTAAGNQGVKIAEPTASSTKNNDYWNYWNGTYNGSALSLGYRYYNRGPSPCTPNSIVTGAMMPGMNSSYKNYKASFSNAGHNVTVFTPGYNVRSAASNTTRYTTAPYFLNSSFKQTNFTGTSAACPQVAGIVALYLQENPTSTQAQVKAWLISNADYTGMYTTGQSDDYTNYQSQWGGNAGVAYQNLQGAALTSSFAKDNTNAWRQAKAVWVKHTDGTWKQAKSGWKKNNAGAWEKIYEL